MFSVGFFSENVRSIPSVAPLARTLLARATRLAHISDALVDVVFVSDTKIKKLNSVYRGVHRSTDVLSFAMRESVAFPGYSRGQEYLGNIFINIDDVRRRAKKIHACQRDIAVFLIVHGFLHLIGHDHSNEKESKRMRALESQLCRAHVYYKHE